jgi:hypothetical protein
VHEKGLAIVRRGQAFFRFGEWGLFCWWEQQEKLVGTIRIARGTRNSHLQRSPFMANIRTDGRWGPWLEETRKMMSEELVLSFR